MADLDRQGRSPLHYAAMDNDVDAVTRRLAAGDAPDLGDRLGFTPLHMAAEEGAVDVARALIERGVEVDQVNSYGNTALFVAVANSRGNGDMIELLRAHGADPLRSNRFGQTPLGLALLIANYDVAQYFSDLRT